MRLTFASIEGFRGFVTKTEIDLDADVIILQGPNGAGKTSLLDAILWALTGRIDRFGSVGSPVSLYAREGIARVVLSIRNTDVSFSLIRSTDGEKTSIRLRGPELDIEGAEAESRLFDLLLPHLKDRARIQCFIKCRHTRGLSPTGSGKAVHRVRHFGRQIQPRV